MSDLNTRILGEIRDELREHRDLLREHSAILREHGDILREHGDILREHGDRLDRLERRQVETEIRLTTELTAVVGAIHELRDAILEDRALRQRVDDHERRIRDLESG